MLIMNDGVKLNYLYLQLACSWSDVGKSRFRHLAYMLSCIRCYPPLPISKIELYIFTNIYTSKFVLDALQTRRHSCATSNNALDYGARISQHFQHGYFELTYRGWLFKIQQNLDVTAKTEFNAFCFGI